MMKTWKMALRSIAYAAIVVALGGTLSTTTVAQDTQIVALEIDGLLQKDGQGLYDQVFCRRQ